MPIYAVTYAYDHRTDEQATVRPEHRAFLTGLRAANVLLASGPVTAGESRGALILVRAQSAEAALAALDDDPFRAHGFVTERAAAQWTVVIGPQDWSE